MHLSPGTWCCTSVEASLNQSPLIYSSMLAAKQGGHLDFRSRCTVLDLPDPELFSSQTCCWCICRKRTIIFLCYYRSTQEPPVVFWGFTVQTTSGLVPEGLQACSLIQYSGELKDSCGWGGEVTAVVSVRYLPWRGTVVFCDCCRAGIAKECSWNNDPG